MFHYVSVVRQIAEVSVTLHQKDQSELNPGAELGLPHGSKMECFATVVNDYGTLLIIVAKLFILNVCEDLGYASQIN